MCKIAIFNHEEDTMKCQTTRSDSTKAIQFPEEIPTAPSNIRQHSAENRKDRGPSLLRTKDALNLIEKACARADKRKSIASNESAQEAVKKVDKVASKESRGSRKENVGSSKETRYASKENVDSSKETRGASKENAGARLSFGKNQKLNFIFGTNLQPKPMPFQEAVKSQQPIPTTNPLSSSEIQTPRLNILPNIRTVNIELEPRESLQTETYEEIDMRTESSIKSESPEELVDPGDLTEVKKRLNEIAQKLHNGLEDPSEERKEKVVAYRPLEHNKNKSLNIELGMQHRADKKFALSVQSKAHLPPMFCPRVTHNIKSEDLNASKGKKEDTTRTHEIVERATRRLSECKGGIKLLQDFAQELNRIDTSADLSEKERTIQLKMAITHIQQAVQCYSIKIIDKDIEFLKSSLNTPDKDSVATNATYATADTPKASFDGQRKSNKYSMQLGKLKLKNSVLHKQLTEIELVLARIEKSSETVKKLSTTWEAQTQTEDWQEVDRKCQILSFIASLSKQQKEDARHKNEAIRSELSQECATVRERLDTTESELTQTRTELFKANREIEKLRRQIANRPAVESALTQTDPYKIEFSGNQSLEIASTNGRKNSNQIAALASIIICKSETIDRDIKAAEKKRTREKAGAEKQMYKECLKRMLTLKAASRAMFSELLNSVKVFLMW